MTLKLIDIHAHLNFPQFDVDRVAVIERARVAEVGMINVGTDLATSRAAVVLAEQNEEMWATVGIHPTDRPVPEQANEIFFQLTDLAKHPKVVGIGECGLDYFHVTDPAEREKQKDLFARQITLAEVVGKPLMIHCRPSLDTQDAYEDILEILSYKLSGNVHFFVGDWPTAKKFLDLNFSLSFTGVLTFTNDYDEVIKNIPLDRIMIETDCPFVAPIPYRGKRNEPSYLSSVVQRIAEIKGLSAEEISRATLANSQRFFGLALS